MRLFPVRPPPSGYPAHVVRLGHHYHAVDFVGVEHQYVIGVIDGAAAGEPFAHGQVAAAHQGVHAQFAVEAMLLAVGAGLARQRYQSFEELFLLGGHLLQEGGDGGTPLFGNLGAGGFQVVAVAPHDIVLHQPDGCGRVFQPVGLVEVGEVLHPPAPDIVGGHVVHKLLQPFLALLRLLEPGEDGRGLVFLEDFSQLHFDSQLAELPELLVHLVDLVVEAPHHVLELGFLIA
ncbi:hypothetical protein ES708_30391 [subsurface metagenome]